ncbi:MAG: MFS transporter [Cytophagaceae bacterium]
MEKNKGQHDPYAALRISNFRLFVGGRLCVTLALQMQAMLVGWQIYEITGDKLALGLIGMAEFIPNITVSLLGAGHMADVLNRKKIITSCMIFLVISAFFLFYFTLDLAPENIHSKALPIYVVIFINGLIRGFIGPAMFAFMAQLIDKNLYSNAVSWNSTIWQAASVSGPAIGGLLLALGADLVKNGSVAHISVPSIAYFAEFFLLSTGLVLFLFLPGPDAPPREKNMSVFASLAEGLSFVFKNQIILSAISLDLFAVLFGGAVALLPAFAKEVLHIGPEKLGYLYAAMPVGSVVMGLFISHNPIKKSAGKKLLFAVAGFGICMISFALSQNFWLSLFILVISGACDGVSVVLRSTLIHTLTPENMKGRVAAVNNVFVGSSNELGAFESGVAARFLGTSPSVIFGGIMTLSVVCFTWLKADKLKKLDLD